MIPTNQQIEIVSSTLALLVEGFSPAVAALAEGPDPLGDDAISEVALARALAVSLGRSEEGDELGRLLRCANDILALSLTVV
jgi:hypothetical protein